MNRRKILAPVLLILASAAIGIFSRRWAFLLPDFLARYTGDAMWALAFFALFRLLLPRASLVQVLLLTLLWSWLIELSQLWHPLWLETIRQNRIGGLILGFGFRWTDLLCYAAGALAGWAIFSLCESSAED
ncbi:MAG: DUF2809 domain-containing protein [Candidatus Cloacimonetes bacterium]|nr:DUF2809 domain-containing protein [Candidatus Cloacimonadota bacterium]